MLKQRWDLRRRNHFLFPLRRRSYKLLCSSVAALGLLSYLSFFYIHQPQLLLSLVEVIAPEKGFSIGDGLDTLTRSSTLSCAEGRILIQNSALSSTAQKETKIPRIVHQKSKSRCVTKKIARAVSKWKFDGWAYYFHDDDALMRLLLQEFPEFPLLHEVVRNCLVHGTLKADLWRYLLLYVYGGVYADIDTVPAKFNSTTIRSDDDAFFVVEQYHLLSQWFMSVSPGHPLMRYAVRISVENLLRATDTGTIGAAIATGPHALHGAFQRFRRDVGATVQDATIGNKPIAAGTYVGTDQREVRVVGLANNQNELVHRDVLGVSKNREYKKMGMRHFLDDRRYATGISCLQAMTLAADAAIAVPGSRKS